MENFLGIKSSIIDSIGLESYGITDQMKMSGLWRGIFCSEHSIEDLEAKILQKTATVCSNCNGLGTVQQETKCTHSKLSTHKYCSHNSNSVQHD